MTVPPQKTAVSGRQRAFVIALDKLIYRFSKRWITVFTLVAAIYVGLPILAPALMHYGYTTPARAIYTIYSPMCHQMASRSFFLFGEQPVYPRELAGTDYTPIEAYMPQIPEFQNVAPNNWIDFTIAARSFLGNDQMGYKMALCERDIAIYGFVLIGSIVYGLLRRYIKPLPIWLFLLIGIGPIAFDGFSQLFGYYFTPLDGSIPDGFVGFLHNLFPLRESSPILRPFTGALFGFMLVWLAYPRIEEGMQETARELEVKLKRIGELP